MSPPTKYIYKHMAGGREKKKGIWKVSGESRVSFCPYLPMILRGSWETVISVLKPGKSQENWYELGGNKNKNPMWKDLDS